MRRLCARVNADDGMSVIELVVASSISLVILASVLQMLDSGTRAERAQEARHQTLVEVRGAVTRLTKDLRQAVSISPSSTPTRLDIQTLMGGVERRAVYEVSDGELSRTLDDGDAVPIASRVTTSEPFCYDPPDCLLAAPSPVPVSISVTVGIEPEAFSSGPITLATEVELRNM